MTRSNLNALKDKLTERDYVLLRDVEKYRLLTTRQIQRLHFDHTHPTPVASARACNRTLARLRDVGVLKALERRIGGVRAGSAGFVWYIGFAGERILRMTDPGTSQRGRRNYREPSRHFVEHTLAVAEVAAQTIEAGRHGHLEVLELQTEPASWQQSLSRFGPVQMLKPDLRLVTASGEYEHHWFIEADLDSEHLPVILRQCAAYEAFRATGRYQAAHGLFPAVLWVTPTGTRAAAIRAAVGASSALFRVCTAAEYLAVVTGRERRIHPCQNKNYTLNPLRTCQKPEKQSCRSSISRPWRSASKRTCTRSSASSRSSAAPASARRSAAPSRTGSPLRRMTLS